MSATLVESCPLGVPWTNVAQKPTPNGVEVTFSSREPSRVDELRERVRDQAHAYGPNLHRGIGHDGTHEGPQNHGLRLWRVGSTGTIVSEAPERGSSSRSGS